MNRPGARMLHTALFALSLAAFGGCGSDHGDPATHLKLAQAAFDDGKLQTALIETKNALKGAPDDPEARFLMARLYLLGDEPDAAIGELQRAENNGLPASRILPYRAQALFDTRAFDPLLALELPPNDSDDLHNRDRALVIALQGYAHLSKRNPDAARAAFDDAIALAPKTEMALLGRVRLALAERDLDSAWSLIGDAAQTLPEAAAIHDLKGDIAVLRGETPAAQAAYTRAVELTPDQIGPRAKLATLLLGSGATSEAEPHLAHMESLAPDDPRTLYSRGLMLYLAGNYEPATIKLEAALAARPSDQRTMLLLGGAHLGLGNFEQSLEQLETFLALQPGSVEAGLLAAQALMAQGEYARAADTLDGVLLRNPKEPRLLALQSRVALVRGNADEAVRWLTALRESEPDTPGLDLSLGLGLLQAGRPQEALEALSRARAKRPDADRIQLTYAEALYASGQKEQALAFARELLDAAPDNRARLTLLGKLLVAEQRIDDARALYVAGLEANPGDPFIGHNLAVLSLVAGRTEEAATLYKSVLTYNTQDVDTLIRLGLLEAENGAVESAEGRLRKALALDANRIQARVALSKIISERESPQLAEQLMNETPRPLRRHPAILGEQARLHTLMNRPLATIETLILMTRSEPRNGAIWLQLAQTQEQQGNLADAAAAYQQAARYRLDDDRFGSLVVRGLYRTGQTDDALALAETLSNASPDNANLGLLLGWLAEQGGDLTRAGSLYKQLLERTSARSAMLSLTNVLSKQGKMIEAITLLDAWEGSHEVDPVTSLARAQVYVDAGDDAAALAILESMLESRPKDAGLVNDAAQLLGDSDLDRAIEYARNALALKPDAPIIQDTLGALLGRAGQWEEALGLLAKAVEGAPDDLEIRLNHARALLESGATERGLTELDRVLARADRGKLFDDAKALQERFTARP